MKHRLTNQAKILILAILVLLIAAVYFLFLRGSNNPINFKSDDLIVEINSEFDYKKDIESVDDGKISDITCDTSKLNTKKIGEYEVIYKYNNAEYPKTVTVKDTVKPSFDINPLEIDLGMSITAKDLVSNVVDNTKVSFKFKEEYSFDKEGKVDVSVIGTDKGNNKTTKKTTITILSADTEAPKIGKLTKKTIKINSDVDLTSDVTVTDNRDPNPSITYNHDEVDLSKVGNYQITYIAKDRSGNEATAKREIEVVKELKEIGTKTQTEEKVVYLTFDDGPSENTKKILDILDRYDAKATFFVTGNSQEFNKYITEANNKGHTIGLHTYCHDYKKIYSSVDAYFEDLQKISDMVEQLTGEKTPYIRFPGGSSNTVSKKYCPGIMTTLSKEVIERGYQYYDWNADSTDASGNNVAVNKLVANGTSSSANNIVMLSHDTSAKNTTVEALPAIIEHYQSLGYKFKGIDNDTFVAHQTVNN